MGFQKPLGLTILHWFLHKVSDGFWESVNIDTRSFKKKVFHNCTGVFSGKSAEIKRCFKRNHSKYWESSSWRNSTRLQLSCPHPPPRKLSSRPHTGPEILVSLWSVLFSSGKYQRAIIDLREGEKNIYCISHEKKIHKPGYTDVYRNVFEGNFRLPYGSSPHIFAHPLKGHGDV